MALRPVEIGTPGVGGSLWLSAMPGRFDAWRQFEADAAAARLALVVCLTPRHEIERHSPAYHAAIEGGALPFRWLNVPMQDFGLAAQLAAFRTAIETAGAALRGGESVLLHCAAGIGRTGTAAACLLKHLGLPAQVALQRVREAGSNPESAAQSGLVDAF